jgi:aryl-alcohol dehydrogenase-like predicted oxidoreductase
MRISDLPRRNDYLDESRLRHVAGAYGEWGSRKYLIASLDQSLIRMGLDYVDVFYSHRPDPETPLEETMGALNQIVRSGKALYVGGPAARSDSAQSAVTWILRQPQITSVLIGASRAAQIEELHAGLSYPLLTDSELEEIEKCLK